MHRPFHLVAFAITALLLWRWSTGSGHGSSRRAVLVAGLQAALCTAALGAIIETLQHVMYNNPMEWWDLRDDALSAFVTILLGQAIYASRLFKKA